MSEYLLPWHQKVSPNIYEGSIFWALLNISDYLLIFLIIYSWGQASSSSRVIPLCSRTVQSGRLNRYTKVNQRICNKNLPWSLPHCLFEDISSSFVKEEEGTPKDKATDGPTKEGRNYTGGKFKHSVIECTSVAIQVWRSSFCTKGQKANKDQTFFHDDFLKACWCTCLSLLMN